MLRPLLACALRRQRPIRTPGGFMTMHTPRLAHHAVAAAAIAALAAPLAGAQTTAPGQLGVIEVTAERRIENIRDVPISVSAISGESLEILNSGGQDIRQLSGRVPSLLIESSFGRAFPRFYIRGLGNTDFDINASQPVSLVFDDVVQENPILKGFPMFDVERVEVLRGPQGTLFGRNATAGVVKFESVKPELGTLGGYGLLTFGTDTMVNAEGAVNVPLGESSALRVSFQSQNRDDWVDNTFAAGPTREFEGFSDNAARVQLLVQPSKDLSILGNLHLRDLQGSARVFRANIIKPGSNDLVDGFDETKVAHDGVNDQDIRNVGGSLRLRWDFGGAALVSITGYESIDSKSRADVDGSAGPYWDFASPFVPGTTVGLQSETADNVPDHSQFTQEFRIESTGTGPLQWLAGVYWFDEELSIEGFSYASVPGNPQNGFITQRQDNQAWAVFGSAGYDVTPQFSVRGGIRYTEDEKDFTVQRFQSPLSFLGAPDAVGPVSESRSASNTSYDLSAVYKLDDATNLYARYATGFRAPSFQGRILFSFGPDISVADSEEVQSIEAGVKADLWDRRARTSLTAFYYEVDGQQLVAVGGGVNTARLLNADKTVGRGIEWDFEAYVTERLLLQMSASYNDTEIQDPNLRVATCGGGCTVTDPIVGGLAVIDGNALPQAPKTIFNLNARYGWPMAGGEAYVLTDWSYRSKVNFFLYESVEFTGKSLLEGGLRFGYIFGDGKYEAAAFVRNLTNEIVAVGGIDFSNLTGFINEPRTWGVSFRASF
jgi:iron complex outermembrane receptor protein